MSTEIKPTTAAEPVALAAPIEVAKPEEVKESEAPIVEPHVASASEVKPLVDDAHKQPTTTHAETGTLHTATEPATTVDGTPAEKPIDGTPAVAFAEPEAETKEEKKEEQKVSAKEKVEKTKAEGKGFFAKFFGSKDKSPKKEKKKTPKTEQADPTPVTEAPATAAETKAEDATDPKVEVTGIALAPEPAVPAHVDAPVASTSAAAEPEAVKETETAAPAPVEPVAETKAEESSAEKDAKAVKAHRRLSTRFTSFVKNIGKKESHHEHGKEPVEHKAEDSTAPVVGDEAPKIAEPTPSEPIQIEEKKPATTTPTAPHVAQAVAAAA